MHCSNCIMHQLQLNDPSPFKFLLVQMRMEVKFRHGKKAKEGRAVTAVKQLEVT